jgi:hypothetical protein
MFLPSCCVTLLENRRPHRAQGLTWESRSTDDRRVVVRSTSTAQDDRVEQQEVVAWIWAWWILFVNFSPISFFFG